MIQNAQLNITPTVHKTVTASIAKAIVQLIVLVFCASTTVRAANINEDYPIPGTVNNVLFYIQRSIDSNVVVYQLNLNLKGEPDSLEPIKVFWIKHTKGGVHENLTSIQKTMSYGVEVVSYDRVKKSFVFTFAGYDSRTFILSKSVVDGQYHVYTFIDNKISIVQRIFINITGGTFWFPTVEHVDLVGKSPKDQSVVMEIIKP